MIVFLAVAVVVSLIIHAITWINPPEPCLLYATRSFMSEQDARIRAIEKKLRMRKRAKR